MHSNLLIGLLGVFIAIIGVITAILIGTKQIQLSKRAISNNSVASLPANNKLTTQETNPSNSAQILSPPNIRQEVYGDQNAISVNGDATVNINKKHSKEI